MRTSRNTEAKNQNHIFEKYMQEKLAVTVIVITLALFALMYVLYRIVDDNKDSYNQIVLSQQEYDSRVIPFRRGDIVDRNGTVLATTEKVYNLILDPRQIMSDQENFLEPTISALVTVFGYDAQTIRSLIQDNAGIQYIRHARQLSYDDKEAFQELQTQVNQDNAKSGSKARVKGVWFEDEYRRIYPNNSLACNVIGFATGDGAGGNGGIEQFYNESLVGTNGREYGYLNDDSNLERVIKPAVNGNTIMSTIDVNIQNVVERRIQEWQAETGSDRVGVVVMNPNNGEVLAMSSDRMFDLNNPRQVSDRYTDEEILAFGRKEAVNVYKNQHKDTGSTITQDQVDEHFSESDIRSYGLQVAWNQEWRNYCISDTYEPGSPSKIFTVSAALEEGLLTGAESFFCDGYQEINGERVNCVKRTGHDMLTVEESLMQSCNDAMMQIVAIMGKDRFCRYQDIFGFGKKTGIDLPGEADAAGLVYTRENMRAMDLATNSFGQNYNCTMIQMAAAYCSVINGGSYYEPHVVRQIVNDQGAVVKKVQPRLVKETVSESTSSFIRQALLRTVDEGTGKAAAVAGYQVAGKTGTAQKYPRALRNYLVSFCGFAPAYDPQVLVYVTVDTPHVEDQPHSTYASGVFQKILADILPYLSVFPETGPEELDGELMGMLPEEEGIRDNETPEPGTLVPETRVYETEEYVEPAPEGEEGLPGQLPDGSGEEESPSGPGGSPETSGESTEAGETENETGGGEPGA
ncbi:MAG: penicillin-binding protein 2 [Lachnospiraceae bacterium]|jgi:stage V sporulation protein D (sporulation-specific penicillin-binding protein)|nr:penicillin-binding protein 2 [Lachnospiraceae bacterium]